MKCTDDVCIISDHDEHFMILQNPNQKLAFLHIDNSEINGQKR